MDATLQQLADRYGIATEFWDWQGRHTSVADASIVAVLRALGADAASPESAAAALADFDERPWRRMLPATVVVTEHDAASVWVHVSDGAPVSVWIDLEGGGQRWPAQQENWNPPRQVGDRLVGEASFEIPTDLPLGYHTLWASSGDELASAHLIVTPRWLGMPERLGDRRAWGLATQLYSVRSRRSWGVGDLRDLADLASWSAIEHGAGFVQVNPLHAAEPVAPMEPSPYLPMTRRFANPLYIRVEEITEFGYLPAADRATIDELAAGVHRDLDDLDRIDRDTAWTAKQAALRLVHQVPRSPGRELSYQAFRRRTGTGLTDFATWSALVVRHGVDWRQWPAELRHPQADDVVTFAAGHPDELDFYAWLQWILDEQLATAQASARRDGMVLGIVHDLAVGVHPGGADTWSLPDIFAAGITVGAPPDAFNQTGQDWNQPPWRPDRLAEVGYAPFRDVVSTVLRHAGGVRVDHVIGLFRLWWIPAGQPSGMGTYVRYDHQAMVGILALEAHRAQAVVVGEDVGTVEPWVRRYLAERGISGTSILWFEFEYDAGGAPLRPEWWREYCLASVTTHDLPPTAGYLAGDHVRLREQLGLLTRSLAEELAADDAEREAWLTTLRNHGALSDEADPEEILLALHRYLTWTPSRLLSVSLTDAVGDRRTQNQPGTVDEYPNWRVPLSGPDGTPLLLEDVVASERAARVLAVLADDRRPSSGG